MEDKLLQRRAAGKLRCALVTRQTAQLLLAGALVLGQAGCMTPVLGPDELTEEEKVLDQAEARRDLGIDYLAKGQNVIALREFLFSVENNPDDPVTQLWLGEAYRRQRHDDKALAAMLRAVELDSRFREAHNNLSAFYLQLERYEEAIEHAQVLIEDPLYNRPWKAFSNRGWAQYKLERISEARTSLETALEFRNDFWPASLNLGILEAESGNTVKAVKQFRRVIENTAAQGPRAEASFRVAQILVSMGHRTKAIKYFTASVKTAPESTWAEESRDYLKILR
ncbi:MAG: tetratricopeptide repeat protein [Deltaproteobacteria bacterium]|nr:tetratricopeptide repeat protein [Deltaproteobacteria bacterium]MBW2725364.1 tetratricopeptide repeat protein [Deltaproteobacteria bacterium]